MQSVAREPRGDDVGSRPASRRGVPGAVLVANGAALVAGAATLLPWTVSGSVARNAFGTVGAAVRLGVLPDGPVGAVAVVWFAVPFLALAALLATATGRSGLGATVSALTGLTAGSLAVAVLRGPLTSGSGPLVALVASGVALGAAVISRWRVR